MNNIPLFLAALPLILGVPSMPDHSRSPSLDQLDPSLFTCENGHFVGDTTEYQIDITNKSDSYIAASSVNVIFDSENNPDGDTPILMDKNAAIAPNETMTLTYNIVCEGAIAGEPTTSCLAYNLSSKTCVFEEVTWVSCNKFYSDEFSCDLYKYSFYMDAFDFTGSEGVVYTVDAGGKQYSFYDNQAKTNTRSFTLDKEIDMNSITISNTQLVATKSNHVSSGSADFSGLGGVFAAFDFLIILYGVALVAGIALIVATPILLVREITRRKRPKAPVN